MPPPIICVDASLTLKLVLPEDDSAAVHRLWERWLAEGAALIAPTLWAYEVTSVIRNRTHRGRLDPALEADALTAAYNLPLQQLAPRGLHQRAWQLARQFDRPAAYDAHYLALAEMADALFWTADGPLFKVVQRELDWVRHLHLRRD